MARIDGSASRSGAVVEPSARQQDYLDRPALVDRKAPHFPESEDALSSTAASPRSMGTIDDDVDINSATEELLPPPAYTPRSTTMVQQHDPEQGAASRQYGTTDVPSQLEDRAQAATGNDETSMLVIRPGGQSYYVRRQRKTQRRRCCACCGLLCTSRVINSFIVVVILTALIAWASHEIRQGWPKNDELPGHDGSPSQPTPADSLIPWPTCPHHITPRHSRHLAVNYNKPGSFSLQEGYRRPPPVDSYQDRHQILGKVHIISAPEQLVDITVQVSIESTEEAIGSAIRVVKIGDELKIDLTDLYYLMPRDSLRSCTTINVILSVASSMGLDSLSTFDVDATHLSIELADKLKLLVTETVSLDTVSGSVASSAGLISTPRRTEVHSVSGHISGVWPLNDLLYLDTVSGEINVNYLPIPSPDDLPFAYRGPPVANLTLTSISGSIEASPKSPLSLTDWPPRRYISRIKSQSGKVCGHYPLGESARFVSTSGRLDVDILPVAFPSHVASSAGDTSEQKSDDMFEAQLSTLTVSGVVEVRVHAAPEESDVRKLFNATQSSHVGTTGRMTITYPTDWAGMLEATSISGKQDIDGKGLEIVESRRGWATNYVKAVKNAQGGDVGGSRVEFETISGSLLFRLTDD